MIAVNINATHAFSLPDDDTVFQLGLFDTSLRNHFNKVLAKGQTKHPLSAEVEVDPEVATQYMLDMVRYGLRGWDLKDAEGKPIPFKTESTQLTGVQGSRQAVTFDTLDHLPQDAIIKIGSAIGDMNLTTKAQEKNSPPPSA